MIRTAQTQIAAVKRFITTAISGFLAMLLGLLLMAIEVDYAQAQCSGKPYKSGNGEWVTNLVPYSNSGRGSVGSYGGSSNNNAAAALGVAGAALGLLGTIMENAERGQQELEQEQRNQAARAQQSARNRYCYQNFVKATAFYKMAQTNWSQYAALKGSVGDFSLVYEAVGNYEKAINNYAPCDERRAIKQTRARIKETLDHIAEAGKRHRENEAWHADMKKWSEDNKKWVERVTKESEERDAGYKRTKEEAVLTGPVAALMRAQESEPLNNFIDRGKQLQDRGLRDALRRRLRERGAISGGPVTCGNVDGKWECREGFSLPPSRKAGSMQQPVTAAETPLVVPQKAPDMRQIVIQESEVKALAEEMRSELGQK